MLINIYCIKAIYYYYYTQMMYTLTTRCYYTEYDTEYKYKQINLL